MRKLFNEEEYQLLMQTAGTYHEKLSEDLKHEIEESEVEDLESVIDSFTKRFAILGNAFMMLSGLHVSDDQKLQALAILLDAIKYDRNDVLQSIEYSDAEHAGQMIDLYDNIGVKLLLVQDNQGKTVNIKVVSIPDFYDPSINGKLLGEVMDVHRIRHDLFYYSMEEEHYHYFLLADMKLSEEMTEVIRTMAISISDKEYIEDELADGTGATNLKFNSADYLISYDCAGMHFEVTYSETM